MGTEAQDLERRRRRVQVPFTIYDPMRMHDWAQKVWEEATAKGSADALETKGGRRARKVAPTW